MSVGHGGDHFVIQATAVVFVGQIEALPEVGYGKTLDESYDEKEDAANGDLQYVSKLGV
jgi:hypothetical protein